ncbi:YeeE/YedE family protein [Candidatus Fermentibacteria bacterium]|nr:MAG: YeeE/YedE family protein [Candidatus Fermentibacteria bacterium]
MTLDELHRKKGLQFTIALLCGVAFGFLLQKGGVTDYNVIIGQLLLKDFTVLKVMLSAVITGSLGIYALKSASLVKLHPKPGSLGSSAVGGLIFGFGFATLGYCPGTVSGAVGTGALDALLGGVVGILIGSGVYAALYPRLRSGILKKGDFGTKTIPEALNVNPWLVVIPGCMIIATILLILENAGL